MSSNAVWVRPRPMFRLINKLMCRFGKLTLTPAFLSLYLLFLYFYFSSSSMSVNSQSLHIQQTQNNDYITHESNTTSSSLKTNKITPFFLGDNSHLTGLDWLKWCECVLNEKIFCFVTCLENTQQTTFFHEWSLALHRIFQNVGQPMINHCLVMRSDIATAHFIFLNGSDSVSSLGSFAFCASIKLFAIFWKISLSLKKNELFLKKMNCFFSTVSISGGKDFKFIWLSNIQPNVLKLELKRLPLKPAKHVRDFFQRCESANRLP